MLISENNKIGEENNLNEKYRPRELTEEYID